MQKIKKNDQVIVLAGKDKGKKGKVLQVILSNNDPKKIIKVVVAGVNLVKKHVKPDPNRNITGGINLKEMPIDISNIALLDPATNKASKVGFKFIDNNQSRVKVRYFKSSQEVIDVK